MGHAALDTYSAQRNQSPTAMLSKYASAMSEDGFGAAPKRPGRVIASSWMMAGLCQPLSRWLARRVIHVAPSDLWSRDEPWT